MNLEWTIKTAKHTAACLTVIYGLTACASYREVEAAREQAVIPELITQNQTPERLTQEAPVTQWWLQMNDEALTRLLTRSLSVNHDIRIAVASLNESRALLQREKWNYAPSITAVAQSRREELGPAVRRSPSGVVEINRAQLETAWELDVFGRVRNRVKVADANLRMREADVIAVQISLAAEVAATYMQLRGIQQLMDIAGRSIALQKQNMRMVQGFAEVGGSTDFELAWANSELLRTAARLPALQQQYAAGLNSLSVLTVLPVEDIRELLGNEAYLPSVPGSVAVGNPADLIKRRPDIARAEMALQAAVAEYNVSVADLYPSISLTGSLGYVSSQWSDLGSGASESFTFAPTIRWAALDLTRVKARINAADAASQGQLANFEKTVIHALKETDDAITRFSQEELRAQSLKSAAAESTKAARLAEQTYQSGRGALRDVIDAERIRLNTAQELVESEVAILLNLVAIYKSLGGGWITSDT